ncbi:hypothetical protein [uncultured Brevibacillus sp.]|uniref:hypothetical protein n=1 Tax=uncultured Brevibacillus sp. TaxID=169970 RepID=UPI002599589E|nr:hypothetical protein [uncultured Brevibacillus sp.]
MNSAIERSWGGLGTNEKKALYVLKQLSYICGNSIDRRDFSDRFAAIFKIEGKPVSGIVSSLAQYQGFVIGAYSSGTNMITITDKGVKFIYNNQKKIMNGTTNIRNQSNNTCILTSKTFIEFCFTSKAM